MRRCLSLILVFGVFNSLIVSAVETKQSTATQYPLETFFEYTKFDDLVLSPTGEYIAASVKVGQAKHLAIMETDTYKMLSTSYFDEESDVAYIEWLSDTRVSVDMVTRVGPLDKPRYTGFMFAVNIDGSQKRQLIPTPPRPGKALGERGVANIVDKLPEEEKYVLVNFRTWSNWSYPTLYKLNIFNGHKSIYEKALKPGASLLMDHNNEVRFSIARDYDLDDDTLEREIYYRSRAKDEWQLVDTLIDKETRSKGTKTFQALGFTIDNKQIYIRKGKVIFLLNPETMEYKELVKIKGDADVTGYISSNDFKNPVIIGYQQTPGYIENTYIDKTHPDVLLEKALAAAFPDRHVNLKNRTKDGNTVLIETWSDKVSKEYYLFNEKTRSLTFLLNNHPERDIANLATMKPFSFIARDGLEIRGYLTLPKGKSKNLPLVQVVHGGPYGVSDTWRFDSEVQFFANRGYAVMQVNYRGSGGRGSDFVLSHYREMGKEMQHDLTDAVHWAIDEGIVNKDKVCIYGASYGGYAALMGVVMEPDLYKCAVPYVGVYDIAIQKDKSDTRLSDAGRVFLKEAWNAYDEEFVKERSPIYHLDKLKAALFFVHGEMDPRVPVENFYAVAEKLDEMDYPYESLVEEGEAHGFRNQENIYKLYRQVDRFLAKYLKD